MKTRSGHRQQRVAAQIHQWLAQALATRVKDPRVGFATLTRVTVSADLSHATVRVSVMGSEEEKAQAMEGLGHARGFLRSILAQSADFRTVPELHFVLDRGLEHAQRIDQLLADIEPEETTP